MIKTVLVATEDEAVARQLQSALTSEGMTVLTADSASEVLSLLDRQPCDLTILQMNLSGVSGVELARICRHRTRALVFLLDAEALEALRPEEFAKELHELLEDPEPPMDPPGPALEIHDWRAEHTVAAHQGGDTRCLILGDLTLHLDRHCLTVGGRRASLTPVQAQILKILIEHSPRVLPPEVFAERIWPGGKYDLSELAAGISSLRTVLDEISPDACRIKHVAGYGFSINPRPQP